MKEWKTKTGKSLGLVADNNRRLYIGKPLYELGRPKHYLYFDTREDLSGIREREQSCRECLLHLEGQTHKMLKNPEDGPGARTGSSRGGEDFIDLGTAYGCWTVTAGFSSYFPRDVARILQENIHRISRKEIPDESLFGKIGSGPEGMQLVVLYPRNLREAVQMARGMKRVFHDYLERNGYYPRMIDNGCNDILEALIGPSDTWDNREMPVIHPERVEDVFISINSCLYG